MANNRPAGVVFAELFALISAARISITETCTIIDVSREAWRGYANGDWAMRERVKKRAEVMVESVQYYIDRAVLPTTDASRLKAALEKISRKVTDECGAPERKSKGGAP